MQRLYKPVQHPVCQLLYVGNRLRAKAHECVACEPPFRSLQVPATQQTRQPAAVVARHQHCCGCCHSESWTQNHASCLWASWTRAIPCQRAKQERCLCHLWPQRQRPDWGMSRRIVEKLCKIELQFQIQLHAPPLTTLKDMPTC